MGRKDRDREGYEKEDPYDSYQKYHDSMRSDGYSSELSDKFSFEEPYEKYNPRPSRRASRRYSRDYDGPGNTVNQGNKRLIIACDGTWQDSNGELQDGKLKPPTNVTRICRAIKAVSSSNVPQVVYYQAGPGSSNGPFDKIVGGAMGEGVAQNMRECFSFLSNNYAPGDEIYFIGFSRGAFTARSVASMVAGLGVLTKKGLEAFAVIMKDYQHRYEKGYKSPQPECPFPNKPSAADPAYVEELYRLGMTIPNVRIKAIGVWDTVGSLGIPKISWLQKMGVQSHKMNEMRFYDTSLSPQVEFAFQILALDERRSPFVPTVWELPKGSPTVLKQVWMAGEHSNVGGGWDDQNLGNISLAWMISNLSPFLDFEDTYIFSEFEKNFRYYRKHKLKPRAWGFGKIYNSMDGIYALGGSETRTPGDYTRCDPTTGERTGKFLRNTRETVHVSVRARIALKGYGIDDEGYYNPKALRGWKFKFDEQAGRYKWINKTTGVELFEMDLGPVEIKLLELYPDVYDYVFDDSGEKYINTPKPKRRSVQEGVSDEVQAITSVIKGLLKT
ncbi:hypothetical protein H072_9264 [Dactylellina haptotyla CBS 200.50]|uniref:T6SS Phospholipase effector Tle1-like catalytic domain-containing protein n=1 Tax=Dactylellina haptotyla (strain CBS 200.50) TaxID=1284197 RepID=S8A300_DACHA|nr:hypothetical protein H072_9264 [Dactylellina haptotyla CBS 200.50]